MFPWSYGFEWTTASALFLGAFYTVIAIVAATVGQAFLRTRRAMAGGEPERIRWLSEFHDLPQQARLCRYALTGETPRQACPIGFDCARCEIHAERVAARPPAEPQNIE